MSNKVSIKKRIKNGEVVVGPFCIVPSGTMIDTFRLLRNGFLYSGY